VEEEKVRGEEGGEQLATVRLARVRINAKSGVFEHL
jgi:hypothetical protein